MRRVDWTRLRWRLSGAWQWPVFVVLTVAEGILLTRLPVWGDGPEGGFVAALLLAACLNLLVVALLAPLLGFVLRRRRSDLPRSIAADYAGSVLLVVLFLGLVVGGIAHRGARQADARARARLVLAVDRFVHHRHPAYAGGLAQIDALRVETGLYRSCVPGPDPQRALCLFVRTNRSPPAVTRDSDSAPNAVYRSRGGFR